MFWHSSPPAVPQGIWHHDQVCLPILLSPQPFKVPGTHFRAFFWLLMANGYICVTMQLVFHDGSPHWQLSLFLVPQFCFCPPFCLLNFVLSYSTWTIISLLLVFYPHSAHSISSSFVFSFVLIPHNSLAFFVCLFVSFPIQQIISQSLVSSTGRLPSLKSTSPVPVYLFLYLLLSCSGRAPGIHHHLLALHTWSFLYCFLFSTLNCFSRRVRMPPSPLTTLLTFKLCFRMSLR